MNNKIFLDIIKHILNNEGEIKPEIKPESASVASRSIGKYVIVRSNNEGINAGFCVGADDSGIILKDARRLWKHAPKDLSQSWYEGVANTGMSENSKISPTVSEKIIIEDYSATVCTEVAEKLIREAAGHAQN